MSGPLITPRRMAGYVIAFLGASAAIGFATPWEMVQTERAWRLNVTAGVAECRGFMAEHRRLFGPEIARREHLLECQEKPALPGCEDVTE